MSACSRKSSPERRLLPGYALALPLAIVSLRFLLLPSVSAQVPQEWKEPADLPNLLELSIEELMNIEVVTVTRRPKALSTLPAAIHVITRDDIRRSGATTLPDILRQAPGVQVAQVHAHQWAVSARGFNDVFANKLLVMIDGRSIYSPLFSGVFWDSHHLLLEDIERVEVIRGPGASQWGANAVNGVINIITRSSRDTQGTLLSGRAGNADRFIGSFRHGGELGKNHFFRVHAQHRDHANFPAVDPPGADDSWNFSQGGFRSDKYLSGISVFTLEGDVYRGELQEAYRRASEDPPHEPFVDDGPVKVRGGNAVARVTRSLEGDADVSVQAYYDMSRRDTLVFSEDRHTVDLDFQHRLPVQDRHLITWGAGYRLTHDEAENTFDISLRPSSRTLQLFSLFAHDQIELRPDRLSLGVGTKLEHNEFTGFEIQPDATLTWMPRSRHTVWGKVARAVRMPSRAERGIRLNQDMPDAPVLISIFGNDRFVSEELLAHELGYRVQPHDAISFDLAAFFNDYNRLRSLEPGAGRADPPPEHQPLFTANGLHGEAYGFELATHWQATDFWRLHGSYSLLRLDLRRREESQDPGSVALIEGSSPKHQWVARSSFDLPNHWEWDTWFRFVDDLPARGIDSYLEMDMRLAWRPGDLEIAIVGRNLLERRHEEFTPSPFVRNQHSEIPRSFYAKLRWRF